ncbi:23S rRNA (adenine(2030)-N(6))-methyltransferase RlmJ [Paraglaciecola sp. 20A4]|uniref:23S rRNA (adenine(2030)-N(6))-methyltransferase RlmJ n=1 Tax=Paraglaciecola sp. 20A4 TaxID=2687288 RepID=UPI00140C6749
MFSYRHGFHAGNHADVLKHICQMLIIDKLKRKDKGFTYIDTHSGAGMYDLASEQARKTNEFKQGITRLVDYAGAEPTLLAYQELTASYIKHQQYPGSPEIARVLMREQDSLHLMEWNNQEVVNLKRQIRGHNVAVHHRDGYEGLIALTPPELKRGLVLTDPSYETPDDYQQVVDSISKAYKRWPTGIFAIWYPLLSKRDDEQSDGFERATSKHQKSQQMLEALSQVGFKNLLQVELAVQDPSTYAGMYGSGMAIINAPWQLDEQISDCLAELTPLLAQNKSASYLVNWLVAEA